MSIGLLKLLPPSVLLVINTSTFEPELPIHATKTLLPDTAKDGLIGFCVLLLMSIALLKLLPPSVLLLRNMAVVFLVVSGTCCHATRTRFPEAAIVGFVRSRIITYVNWLTKVLAAVSTFA